MELDQPLTAAAQPSPNKLIWAKVVLKSAMWLFAHLSVITSVSSLSGFTACNAQPCLYYVRWSRQYQPAVPSSYWGWVLPVQMFATVQNVRNDYDLEKTWYWPDGPAGLSIGEISWGDWRAHFPYVKWYNKTTEQVQAICDSTAMHEKIIQDQVGPSYKGLIFMICVNCLLHGLHDGYLLAGAREARAAKIGIASFASHGITVVLAFLWGSTLAETFVSVEPGSFSACFYQLPDLPMLMALVCVAQILITFLLRLPKILHATHFGDYLYLFKHDVPYRVIAANLPVGTDDKTALSDATCSLLVPSVAGDRATNRPMPVPLAGNSFFKQLQDWGGPLPTSFYERTSMWLIRVCLKCLWVCLYMIIPGILSGIVEYRNFGMIVFVIECFAVLCGDWILAFGHGGKFCMSDWVLRVNGMAFLFWPYIGVHIMEYSGISSQRKVKDYFKSITFTIVDFYFMLVYGCTTLTLTFLAPAISRAGFLLFQFVPWLGKGGRFPEPDATTGTDVYYDASTATDVYYLFQPIWFLSVYLYTFYSFKDFYVICGQVEQAGDPH